jgi:hypothetical protein
VVAVVAGTPLHAVATTTTVAHGASHTGPVLVTVVGALVLIPLVLLLYRQYQRRSSDGVGGIITSRRSVLGRALHRQRDEHEDPPGTDTAFRGDRL